MLIRFTVMKDVLGAMSEGSHMTFTSEYNPDSHLELGLDVSLKNPIDINDDQFLYEYKIRDDIKNQILDYKFVIEKIDAQADTLRSRVDLKFEAKEALKVEKPENAKTLTLPIIYEILQTEHDEDEELDEAEEEELESEDINI